MTALHNINCALRLWSGRNRLCPIARNKRRSARFQFPDHQFERRVMSRKFLAVILLVCICLLWCAVILRYEPIGDKPCGLPIPFCTLVFDRWEQKTCFSIMNKGIKCSIHEVVESLGASTTISKEQQSRLPTMDEAFGDTKRTSQSQSNEWMQFVPIGVPLLIGFVAAWFRRNGWKWGAISFIGIASAPVVYSLWQSGRLTGIMVIFGVVCWGGVYWLFTRKRNKTTSH